MKQTASSYCRSLGLYITCTEDSGSVEEVHISARPLGSQSASCAAARIAAYYDSEEGELDAIPVTLSGSEFDRIVWTEIRKLPPGQVITYGEVAARVGRKGAARAVGGSMKRNRLVLLVPCHRVVSSSGLGGYSAHGGLATKRKLLQIEREISRHREGRQRV